MKVKQQQEVVIGNSKSLRRFVNSINSPHTEETYVNNIKGYIKFHNIKDFDSLLEIDKEKTFEMIEDYITFNRKEKQRSSSRINGIICSIRLFYSVNRYDDLNWYILARFKGKERRKMIDDRAYTREEIQKIYSAIGTLQEYKRVAREMEMKNDPLIQFLGDVKEDIIRITFNCRTYWETTQNRYISDLDL